MHSHAITEFLFLEDREVEADFTIVLGMTGWSRPLSRALDLYGQGKSGKLIFSGGWNPALQAREAELMAGGARERGVGTDHILCESHSRNTRENFTNSLRIIEETWDRAALSINIVAIEFHIRRALMTAGDVFPSNTMIGIAGYPSKFYTRAEWSSTERGRRDVTAELTKIERYFPGRVPASITRELEGPIS